MFEKYKARAAAKQAAGKTGFFLAKPAWRKAVTRLIGVFLLFVSLSFYVQALPLFFVFSGAYIGLPQNATVGSTASVIWILSCVAIIALSLYIVIAWLRFLWFRLIVHPKPLFEGWFKKHDA